MNDVFLKRLIARRNFADMPFPSKMRKEDSAKVIDRVKNALSEENVGFQLLEPQNQLLLEESDCLYQPNINPEIARCVLKLNAGKVLLYLNYEDAVELHIYYDDILEAESLLYKIEHSIFKKNKAAFSMEYFFLTSKPRFSGVGAEIRFFAHVPMLEKLGKLPEWDAENESKHLARNAILCKSGKKSESVYYFSNKGANYRSIKLLHDAMEHQLHNMMHSEKQLENTEFVLGNDFLEDEVFRSKGILENARILDFEEFLERYAMLLLGAEHARLHIAPEKLQHLLFFALPHSIAAVSHINTLKEEKQIRAGMVRLWMKENT